MPGIENTINEPMAIIVFLVAIYGKDEIGSPRAYLQFTMYNECYRFLATTNRQVLIINFDRKNQVRSIELHKEDS